jgi:hypothetical protein
MHRICEWPCSFGDEIFALSKAMPSLPDTDGRLVRRLTSAQLVTHRAVTCLNDTCVPSAVHSLRLKRSTS